MTTDERTVPLAEYQRMQALAEEQNQKFLTEAAENEALRATLARIYEFHRPHPDEDRLCVEGCGGGWPCSTRLEAAPS